MSNSVCEEATRGVYRITDMEISFVSACAQGANPGAKVFLKKEKGIMPNRNSFAKSEDGKDKPININLDVDGLSKSIGENIKASLGELLAKSKDVSADVLAETVVAVVAGDLTNMQKAITEELGKAIADVQKDIDEKLAKAKDTEDKVNKTEEVVEINGVSFKKSVVGEGAFAAIKASAEQSNALRKEMEHTKLVARVEKEYPNIAGKPDDKAALLSLIEKSSDSVKECGMAILKAMNEAGAEFKKEVGGSYKGNLSDAPGTLGSDTDASMKLDKMAKELAQKDNISVAQAYGKILETPEGSRLYDEHLAG